jgi:hypothetical protein
MHGHANCSSFGREALLYVSNVLPKDLSCSEGDWLVRRYPLARGPKTSGSFIGCHKRKIPTDYFCIYYSTAILYSYLRMPVQYVQLLEYCTDVTSTRSVRYVRGTANGSIGVRHAQSSGSVACEEAVTPVDAYYKKCERYRTTSWNVAIVRCSIVQYIAADGIDSFHEVLLQLSLTVNCLHVVTQAPSHKTHTDTDTYTYTERQHNQE